MIVLLLVVIVFVQLQLMLLMLTNRMQTEIMMISLHTVAEQ